MALQATTQWIQGLGFEVEVRNHFLFTDAQKEFGSKDRGPNPKEYVLSGLCGCTGMDVISLLKKFKINVIEFSVTADAELTQKHPIVFSKILLTFKIKALNADSQLAHKAVHDSMTKYCGVSAMLSKAVTINYKVLLNDQEIGAGQAQFENM